MKNYADKLQAIVDAAKADIAKDPQIGLLDDFAVASYMKKQFALLHAKKHGADAGMLFKVFDGYNAYEVVRNVVAASTGTQPKVDSVRRLIGDVQYRYIPDTEDQDLEG